MNLLEGRFNPSFSRTRFKRKAIPKSVKFTVMDRDKLRCIQCFSPTPITSITKHISLSNGIFHHIIPLVYGGQNVPENICILCPGCHREAHTGRETPTKYHDMFSAFIRHGWLFPGMVNNE